MTSRMYDVEIKAMDAAIRADERAKCRAELRAKLAELCDTRQRQELWPALLDWARGPEAFDGE